MTTTTDNETIDLRDEIEFLRQLVERLLGELKETRTTAYPHVMVLPTPIIIEQPVVRASELSKNWWQTPWYAQTICTSDTLSSIGNDLNSPITSGTPAVSQLQWAMT